MSTTASIASRLVSLYGSLERTDRSMEIYEGTGTTYPSYDFYTAADWNGTNLSRLAAEFRAAMPEQANLANRLDAGAHRISADAGTFFGMWQNESPFGAGWGSSWDGVIETVRQAIEVLMTNPK